jgi:hypothetical protein
MRLDYLIDRLLAECAEERVLLRRITRYLLPLLLVPIGFALAQVVRGWPGLLAGGIGALVLMYKIELFLRPARDRARVAASDIYFYLGPPAHSASTDDPQVAPTLAPVVPLLVPSALMLAVSLAVFLPTLLAAAAPWQRLLALALGLVVLWAVWQRLAQIAPLLDRIERRLVAARTELLGAGAGTTSPSRQPSPSPSRPPFSNGLLDPRIGQRIAGLPLPLLALSPAAQALLRVEAYLLLRDYPTTTDRVLFDALAELGRQAHAEEQAHWLLPPVGGKLYLPIAAHGVVATMLAATVRRMGMDGGYSASLGTWLVRLPPARSYAVAGRLIDALLALGLPPPGAILPHHLTVQGDLGQASKLLSIVHLAATPLLFAERSGHAQGDDRPFIMRGGGVLDDMAGRGRLHGPRTDFVDGFVFAGTPGLTGVEHVTGHAINLRVKQVLAGGLLADARPYDRRAPFEQELAATYGQLRADTRALLAAQGLDAMLDIAWLDGGWSEVWPLIQRMSDLKERDPSFLDTAQRLRDGALDRLELIATAATREGPRTRTI